MKALFFLAAAAPTAAALHVASLQPIRPPTALNGLLGRFRNQRKVEQVATIQPGATIPVVDVEKLTIGEDGSVTSEVVSIRDVLGTSKAILIGEYGLVRQFSGSYRCYLIH
jgi:hypothetical protein